MPQGRHCLFRFGAFVAARGIAHRSMFGYRPPNISHAYNVQPCTISASRSRVVATAIALAWCLGAVLDRLRLVSARHRRP